MQKNAACLVVAGSSAYFSVSSIVPLRYATPTHA